ncbi:insulin-like peptide 7 [Glandiceps talaboti]
MKTPLTFLTFCVSIFFAACLNENAYENVETLVAKYSGRTDADWRAAWNTESHNKCRNSLFSYVIFSCMIDIHAARDRKRGQYPFLDHADADKYLSGSFEKRMARFRRASPSEECCSNRNGCTWEELAEYCSHQRDDLDGR